MRYLGRLLKYTSKYYKNITLSIIAMLLQVASGFIIPLLMKNIIDTAIPEKDY